MLKTFIRNTCRYIRELYYYLVDRPNGMGYIMMCHHVLPLNANGHVYEYKTRCT